VVEVLPSSYSRRSKREKLMQYWTPKMLRQFVILLSIYQLKHSIDQVLSFPIAIGRVSRGNTIQKFQSKTLLLSSVLPIDEDEEIGAESSVFRPKVKVSADMRYIPYNIMRQVDNFKKIQKVGGSETVNDVYVRDPEVSTFWFSGKIARCTGTVSIEEAVARQWCLIEQHASRLRLSRGNNELGPKFGELEIWAAPADSELGAAYNRPDVKFVKMSKFVEGVIEKVKSAEVGFKGELYNDDEEGFRTERKDDGTPLNPELKGFEGNTTNDEMSNIMVETQKDIK